MLGHGRKLQSLAIRALVATYDFAELGGAVGDITLKAHKGQRIPANSLVVGATMRVETVPVGATATIAVKVEGAGDIQAAAAISGAPWSTVGAKVPSAAKFDAGHILTTVDRNVAITVGTAALTAGKIQVVIFFTVLP